MNVDAGHLNEACMAIEKMRNNEKYLEKYKIFN